MDSKKRFLADEQSELYKVGNSPQRILIIWALSECVCTVSGLAKAVDASPQNTSQHLNLMEDKSVMTSRSDCREIYYRIVDDESVQNCHIM